MPSSYVPETGLPPSPHPARLQLGSRILSMTAAYPGVRVLTLVPAMLVVEPDAASLAAPRPIGDGKLKMALKDNRMDGTVFGLLEGVYFDEALPIQRRDLQVRVGRISPFLVLVPFRTRSLASRSGASQRRVHAPSTAGSRGASSSRLSPPASSWKESPLSALLRHQRRGSLGVPSWLLAGGWLSPSRT